MKIEEYLEITTKILNDKEREVWRKRDDGTEGSVVGVLEKNDKIREIVHKN